MLITTDTGIKEDTVIYGIGGKDVFLPLSMFSYILNLNVDSSVKKKPLLYSKDKSVYVELNVDSVLATVNRFVFGIKQRLLLYRRINI